MKSFLEFISEAPLAKNIQMFMREFEKMGYGNPINPRELVIDNEALVELSPWGDGSGIHLSSIRTVNPKQGGATRVMKKILALADKCGVTIDGSVVPYGKNKDYMKKGQLMRWYKSLGFKQQPYYMGPGLSDRILYTPKGKV